jgi:uncharacterized protein (DUF4415 family)
MAKRERIVRHSAEEVAAMIARGESRTDWARVKAMPQEEVERLADEEDGPLPEGWESTIVLGPVPRKHDVHIRLDADVLDWFRARGKATRPGSMRCCGPLSMPAGGWSAEPDELAMLGYDG